MNIRFTSTLTSEDENRLAPALLNALSGLLDLLPIAYVLEVETSDLHLYEHGGQRQPHVLEPDLLGTQSRTPMTIES